MTMPLVVYENYPDVSMGEALNLYLAKYMRFGLVITKFKFLGKNTKK